MGEAEVQRAVTKLLSILETEGLPYAIIGALALNQYGHRAQGDEEAGRFSATHRPRLPVQFADVRGLRKQDSRNDQRGGLAPVALARLGDRPGLEQDRRSRH